MELNLRAFLITLPFTIFILVVMALHLEAENRDVIGYKYTDCYDKEGNKIIGLVCEEPIEDMRTNTILQFLYGFSLFLLCMTILLTGFML